MLKFNFFHKLDNFFLKSPYGPQSEISSWRREKESSNEKILNSRSARKMNILHWTICETILYMIEIQKSQSRIKLKMIWKKS